MLLRPLCCFPKFLWVGRCWLNGHLSCLFSILHFITPSLSVDHAVISYFGDCLLHEGARLHGGDDISWGVNSPCLFFSGKFIATLIELDACITCDVGGCDRCLGVVERSFSFFDMYQTLFYSAQPGSVSPLGSRLSPIERGSVSSQTGVSSNVSQFDR